MRAVSLQVTDVHVRPSAVEDFSKARKGFFPALVWQRPSQEKTIRSSKERPGTTSPDADPCPIELAAHGREPFAAIEEMLSEWPELGF